MIYIFRKKLVGQGVYSRLKNNELIHISTKSSTVKQYNRIRKLCIPRPPLPPGENPRPPLGVNPPRPPAKKNDPAQTSSISRGFLILQSLESILLIHRNLL